jgi:hypothetical protein
MRSRKNRWSTLVILAAATLPLGACTPSAQTQSDLAALIATSAGSIVQIFVKNYFDHLLTTGANVDPTTPISEQQH